MLCVAIVNTVPSSHSDLAAQLTPERLASMAAACQLQLQRDVAPAWGSPGDPLDQVRLAPNTADVGPQEDDFEIDATLADAPGAEAYHDDNAAGVPDGFLATDTVQTPGDVCVAMSHEFCETKGDPACNSWVPHPSKPGLLLALELCDPVQARSYEINGESVSDFCLKPYFDKTLSGPTTYLESIGAAPRIEPGEIAPGGYQLVKNADGTGETQIFGTLPPSKAAMVAAQHPSSNLVQRGLKAAA